MKRPIAGLWLSSNGLRSFDVRPSTTLWAALLARVRLVRRVFDEPRGGGVSPVLRSILGR